MVYLKLLKKSKIWKKDFRWGMNGDQHNFHEKFIRPNKLPQKKSLMRFYFGSNLMRFLIVQMKNLEENKCFKSSQVQQLHDYISNIEWAWWKKSPCRSHSRNPWPSLEYWCILLITPQFNYLLYPWKSNDFWENYYNKNWTNLSN